MKNNMWTEPIKRYFLKLEDHEVVISDGKFDLDSCSFSYVPSWYGDRDSQVDWIISFLSPKIIPKETLDLATHGAINFHPGPPSYPGIGCYNFALWDNAQSYGVTCHHMLPKVDSGAIVDTMYFPIHEKATVRSLQQLTMAYLQIQFYTIMGRIFKYNKLEPNGEEWKRKPYTRKHLQDFCNIRLPLTPEEELRVDKWLRASYYPNARDPPTIEIKNKKWKLEPCE